jgi:hypothetical protein
VRRDQVADTRDSLHGTPRRRPEGWYPGPKAGRCACESFQGATMRMRAEIRQDFAGVHVRGPRVGHVEEIAQTIANGPMHERAMLQRVREPRGAR